MVDQKPSVPPIPPQTTGKVTPTMEQWFSLKNQEPDALLFFRMGDFYELFFGDAQAAALALDITLTHRGTHDEEPIPMCGVPVGTAQIYLSRLIRRGFRVAVAEQTELPRKGQKGPLRREIIRVVTPGTLTEDELLDAGRANTLLAIVAPDKRHKDRLGAAWIDISTGTLELLRLGADTLAELLARIAPSEILSDPTLIPTEHAGLITPSTAHPSHEAAERTVTEAYQVAQMDALGDFSNEQIIACAVLLDYVRRSQAGKLPRLAPPIDHGLDSIMGLDPATRSSLDILQSRDGGSKHTLFSSVNQTATAAGTRLLAHWVSTPSTDLALITGRQDGWHWLHHQPKPTGVLRDILKHAPDSARALGRISSGRPLPRDLAAIRDTLRAANQITETLGTLAETGMPERIRHIGANLYGRADALLERLEAALNTELPVKIEDGGVIAPGFDAELDRQRDLRDNSRRLIAQLQVRLAEDYGISNLRIRHHNQLGYVIEVPAAAGRKLRQHEGLSLRQGTASLARFSNEELTSLNQAILEASEKADQLERHLFADLARHCLNTPALDDIGLALAELDALISCARIMDRGTWCRPTMTNGQDFNLQACRHPVVEAALHESAAHDTAFIANDCALPPEKHAILLTGPNMAGKSTFLRQNALAVILAQAGLPIPAKAATIGIVDRLFSRVGAADDLARGRSTFMVEMTETAAILNQAGPRSLVVVDEIGRGTSTLDGLSIAWATLEALHSQLRCRTIFATHFHELGALLKTLPRLAACTMAVKEWKGHVVFQHEVRPGLAQKSWGLHVAKLAGIPASVLQRARNLLTRLENERDQNNQPASLPLFEQAAPEPPIPQNDPPSVGNCLPNGTLSALQALHKEIEGLDPDSLSPREAHSALYQLKSMIDGLAKMDVTDEE
ncbi:DNA mismatch repair protein MutS [Bombella intestini]|uniref:DNA mismatch repair protein MutS n=1 Tax=Bombella intestini TaxID=1539051 RepID=UPI001F4E2A77|nr:DNA mismatch repair protein MutS [Bombella intestini]